MKQKAISLLRKSEKYTETDMVYLFKNSFWVFLGQITTSISLFIMMVVLANLLPKEDFGEFRYLLSMLMVLSVFTLPSLDTALSQSTANKFSGQLKKVIKVKKIYAILATVFAFLLSGYYLYNGNTSLSYSFLFIALLMPIYGTYNSYFFYLQGIQKFNEATILQSLGKILLLVVMVVTAYLTPTTSVIIAAFMLSTAVPQILASVWTRVKYKEEDNFDSELISYGKYLTIIGTFPLLAVTFDKIIIWNQLGASEVAVYSIAMMIPFEGARLGRVLNQIAMPKLTANNVSIPKLFKKIFLLEILLFLIWLTYALIAPMFFSVFFPSYTESVNYSIVGMLLLLFSPNLLMRAYLFAKKMKKEIKFVLTFVPITQLVLMILALPVWGISGIIGVLLFGAFLEFIILIFILNKK